MKFNQYFMYKKTAALAILLSITLTGCTGAPIEEPEEKVDLDETKTETTKDLVYKMSGPSMIPTIDEGNILTVEKTTEYQREDIVVYQSPNDENQKHVHRIVGLPNETIKLEEGNLMIINDENPEGTIPSEPYLDEEMDGKTFPNNDMVTFELPANGYFTLGDNRTTSADSRHCFRDFFEEGCNDEFSQFYITENEIIGKVVNIKKLKSDIELPETLSSIEKFKNQKDIVNPQVHSAIKGFLEHDSRYTLLSNYMTENYSYDIAEAKYITTLLGTVQYLGISYQKTINEQDSQTKQFVFFTALYPLDADGNKDETLRHFYYIKEQTAEGTVLLYIENKEIKEFVAK
jgi:signal peptidase I